MEVEETLNSSVTVTDIISSKHDSVKESEKSMKASNIGLEREKRNSLKLGSFISILGSNQSSRAEPEIELGRRKMPKDSMRVQPPSKITKE